MPQGFYLIVLLHNSTLLNTIYQKMITEKVPQSVINEFIRISPIAWFYITFTGRYNFKKNTGKIDLQEILNTLEAKVRET